MGMHYCFDASMAYNTRGSTKYGHMLKNNTVSKNSQLISFP
jgi:hypothetical protein